MFINSRQFLEPKQMLQLMNNVTLCIINWKFQMVWIFLPLWKIMLLKIHKYTQRNSYWSNKSIFKLQEWCKVKKYGTTFPTLHTDDGRTVCIKLYKTSKNIVKLTYTISGKNLQIYTGFKNKLSVLQTICTRGEESQRPSLNIN